MKKTFNTVALCSNSNKDHIIAIASQCMEVLLSQKIKVLIDSSLSRLNTSKIKPSKEKEITKKADLLIAIGGDGTMLKFSRIYGYKGIPILGINLGKLGFLTDINPQDLTSDLLRVLKGDFSQDERSFLEASIKGRKKEFIALNEVVIHSGSIAQLIEFDLFINNSFVYRQKADGLIISSPTGSTAYSLSGGGPIVHPELEAFILTPMLPQSLSTSPLVVKDNSLIRIKINNQKATLSFDSHNSIILSGKSQINICKAQSKLNLIHPINHDFFEGCRNKLSWSTH